MKENHQAQKGFLMKKYYGQFDPPVDKLISQRYFPDPNIKGVAVECGAFDGLTECSCKFFEEFHGWKCYNLEPAPANFAKLEINRPHSTNLKVGLSNESGTKRFTHVISPLLGENFGNGSIQHTHAHLEDLRNHGCQFQEVHIDVLTWRDFITQAGLTQVDLLVLDVEGHELAVLEGMVGCNVLPDVMCVEVGHLDFSDIRDCMSRLGYVYDISSHVNAFFVRLDRLQLFSLRRAAYSIGNDERDFVTPTTTLQKEIQRLTNSVQELSWQNTSAASSISGRAFKWIRQLLK